MKQWLFSIWKTNKRWLKQRTASILCMLMVFQILTPNLTVSGIRAFAANSPNTFDIKELGSPSDAFTSITLTLGDKITDGNKLSMQLDFQLDSDWLETENDKLPDGESLPPLTFSVQINKNIFDVSEIQSYIDRNNNIIPNGIGNKSIGHWSMTETANALKFQGNVTDIEGYFDIFAGLHFDLTLNNTYDGSQTILAERVHGEPDIDIRITIDGSDTPSSGASSFSMTKEAKQGFDADGQEDLSAINYIITAKASSSNLTASASNSASSSNSTNSLNLTASSSNLNDILNSTASNSNATHYFTSTTSNSTQKQSILDSKALISNSVQYDDDFDEETDEDDEIELFNDLFELWTFAPTKSRYENTHKESVFYSLEHVEDNPLYGKYITDQLHEDLELYAVRYSINGTDWEELQNWNDYLDEENRTFSYPIGEEIANSSEFKIQLYTKIKDTFWENYNGTEATFSNQAVLNDGDKPIARSNPAEPKLRSDIELTKEGLPQEVNGSIYRWDVTIDTDFSFNTNLYAVDLIRDADNTHSYLTASASDYPITITENGSSQQTLTVHVLTQDELDNSPV